VDLKQFKASCFYDYPDVVVQKYLIDGVSYFFEKYYYGGIEEFNFKKDLAISLDVHIRDIVLIGSAKLGFSIKPDKDVPSFYPFKSFDFDVDINNTQNKSDLDIAIVSNHLFDDQLLKIYKHTNSYTVDTFKGSIRTSFANYALKGWIKPEFIPEDYTISPLINKIQERYQFRYQREINIGLYKSWFFFENYHQNNIRTIKLNLISQS
jgi:hypothetical protein